MSNKAQRVAELMAQYMRQHGGPVDMSKAVPYIKRKLNTDSDKEATDLIRQSSVVELNPINRKNPPKVHAMRGQISYGEAIDNAVNFILGEENG